MPRSVVSRSRRTPSCAAWRTTAILVCAPIRSFIEPETSKTLRMRADSWTPVHRLSTWTRSSSLGIRTGATRPGRTRSAVAGWDAAGWDEAGLDAAGGDPAGLDAAGLDAAGLDAAGCDAAGCDAAGGDAAGGDAVGCR